MSRSRNRIPFSTFVKTARPLVVEGYYYDFTHYPVDVPGFVRHIRSTGANLVRLGTLMGTVAAYPSRYVGTYPGIEGRDWVREMTDECEKSGIRVINYVALATGWTCGDAEATRAVLPKGIPWYSNALRPCLSGEALDWTLTTFVEVMERYHPEALYIDGCTVPPLCRCPQCSKAFRERTRGTIPRSFDLTHKWMMPYVSWLNGHRAAIYGKIVRACRKVVPELYVIVNMGDWKNTLLHPRGAEDRMMIQEGVGTLHYENRSPASSSYVLEATKFGQVIGRPVWAHCLDLFPFNNFVKLPAREVVLKGIKILAGGGTPEAYCHGSTLFQEGRNSGLRTVFDFIRKNEAVLRDRENAGDCALLYSEQSTFHALHQAPTTPGNHILTDAHFDGMFRALTRCGIPFAVIGEQNLEQDLSKGRYKTLYLANSFYLSPGNCRIIREFVRKGGNLVASFQTTLGRSPFREGANFALADVFGVRYVKTASLGGGHYIRKRSALCSEDSLASIVAVTGNMAAVRTTTGAVIADLCSQALAKQQTMSLKGLEVSPATGIILNRYGRGKAVYLPFPLELTEDKAVEQMFWYTDDRYALNSLSLVLGDIDRLLNPRPGIRLRDENMKAEFGLFKTSSGMVAIVYDNKTVTGEILFGKSDLRRVFLLLPPKTYKRARSLRTGKRLAVRQAADGTHDYVVLNRLDLFDAVRLSK